jgi:hypothetical protein
VQNVFKTKFFFAQTQYQQQPLSSGKEISQKGIDLLRRRPIISEVANRISLRERNCQPEYFSAVLWKVGDLEIGDCDAKHNHG